VGEADRQALVTRVFAAYLALMRKVQTTYWCAQSFGDQIAVPCCRPLRKVLAQKRWPRRRARAGAGRSHSARGLGEAGGLRKRMCVSPRCAGRRSRHLGGKRALAAELSAPA
jgi:hypothetical protein